MGNVGGKRNYGYGKKLAWAGKNALADRYGQGHFSTRATHAERWNQFAAYLKTEGINDARKITLEVLTQYSHYLEALVNNKALSVAYAQNLLSTVNVVLETMRKDTVLHIKPAKWVGQRSHVRQTVPVTIKPDSLELPITRLQNARQNRTAHIALLARHLGLRFKEASMLDCKLALRQANQKSQINIKQGTKGGRGKGADRWIPVNDPTLNLLKQAAKLQANERNLIPPGKTYRQWRDQAYNQWRKATENTAINGFHDMRAAYACERYEILTGYPAPVIAGERQASKALDINARTILAQELGHNRRDVVAAYIGSSK